nr:MAG TPA: hypothetical protein [Caudoviricetes sp.]
MQISPNEIEHLKKYISNRISYARYYAQGGWSRIEINKVDILTDGRIAIYLLLNDDVPNQINKIEFYTSDNELFASGDETINKELSGGDVLYRYTIALSQTLE